MMPILIYVVIGIFFGIVLRMLNGLVFAPMIVLYYVRIKREPGKIISWLIRKTTNPGELMMGILLITTLGYYRKFMKNKIRKNG